MQLRRSFLGLALAGAMLAVASALFPAASVAGAQEASAAPPAPVTVICVRHAEKILGASDPELSPVGVVRAETLARLLGHAGVTHVFASEWRRTQATVAPLAAALGVDVTVVPAGDPADQIAALDALPGGSVAVVAGHSNTVPGVVRGLGGTIEGLESHPRYGPMLADSEYDRLFVVTRSARADGERAVSTVELRYGD